MSLFLVTHRRSGSTYYLNKLSEERQLKKLHEEFEIANNAYFSKKNARLSKLLRLQHQWQKEKCCAKIFVPTQMGWQGPVVNWFLSELPDADVVYLQRKSAVDTILSHLASTQVGSFPIYKTKPVVDIEITSISDIELMRDSFVWRDEIINNLKKINPGTTVYSEDIFKDNYKPYVHNYNLINKVPGEEALSVRDLVKKVCLTRGLE